MAIVHQRGWAPHAHRESPWYFPLRASWRALEAEAGFPTPARLSELYAARSADLEDLPPEARRLRFAPAPAKKPRRRAQPLSLSALYEGQIAELQQVPTRLDDWHDFFNALSFVAFPRAKWALHHRQYAILRERIGPGARRLPGARTREQDALALFDEGGIALLVAPQRADELTRAAHDDLPAAAASLCAAGEAQAVPFGHALYEHLIEHLPCPLGTLHVLPLAFAQLAPEALLCALDRALARDLGDPALFTAPSPARGLALPEIAAGLAEMPENPDG